MNKQQIRQQCLKKLQRAAKGGRASRSLAVNREILKFVGYLKPKTVLLYLPLGMEVDISPLFAHLRRKARLYVPFMEGVSFKLVQLRLPLKRKQFGILEPGNSQALIPKIDMAIVPVVGVGRNFRRIGFGKGMYDRFFAKLSYRPVMLFVQLDGCIVPDSLTDEHDIQADIYINPVQTLIRGNKYGYRTIDRRCRRRH